MITDTYSRHARKDVRDHGARRVRHGWASAGGTRVPMNAGQLAALIAAAFFAVGVCAAVFVLARLGRLIAAATALVTSYQDSADDLLARARATVARADRQLARTGALADGVDEVADSMSELAGQVSAVAGTARLIAVGLGTPVVRLAA